MGSCLDDVWRAWSAVASNLPARLAVVHGWMPEEIVGVESYRDIEAHYHLPTLTELRRTLNPEFVEIECAWGLHEQSGGQGSDIDKDPLELHLHACGPMLSTCSPVRC